MPDILLPTLWDGSKKGSRQLCRNIKRSGKITVRAAKGYFLTLRERRLLVRTTGDCLKLVPFSAFVLIPFAELALPIAIRLFPNMMPSTFSEEKHDCTTLSAKLKAKRQMAVYWQEVMKHETEEITKLNDDSHEEKVCVLKEFQEQLLMGTAFPTTDEVRRFCGSLHNKMRLRNMASPQIRAMSRMLGLNTTNMTWMLRVQLRHHMTRLRREDRDFMWEGVSRLSKAELIEACKSRAIIFHGVDETTMRNSLVRWVRMSSDSDIPYSLLLWIQAFYLKSDAVAKVGEAAQDKLQEVKKQAVAAKDEDVREPKQEVFEQQKKAYALSDRSKTQLDNAKTKLEELQSNIDGVVIPLETAQYKLRDLKKDIDEAIRFRDESAKHDDSVMNIMKERAKVAELSPRSRVVSVAKNDDGVIELKDADLKLARTLHRSIVARQYRMLNHQLALMSTIRETQAEEQRTVDAEKMLLDQQTKLQEMLNSVTKHTTDIEALLTKAGPRRAISKTPNSPRVSDGPDCHVTSCPAI